ncbi:serine hydrolase [Legionella oakridgensis]|uniref:Beta-lactamase class C and other penicillin binding protein n=2 Tax=Legionella oakridgensis TaxID=29423 RepID=W0B8P3_9GAMM|nr:serine hydrolase [Legionella oakridgensis]AHE66235.1 beta-lactamase class C and other penicillin binding protein [Legionella oakridgensis ATCC 33761 = DSM 21215]ETO93952.1 beta-lactamase class C and other penicillin binding protein [Legionella oakridgensis RV-2-2007]KTD44769.1 beta-lactamase [Legionella oakridgensis]STY16137.1 beta-lactamase [Legionella longbeachae]
MSNKLLQRLTSSVFRIIGNFASENKTGRGDIQAFYHGQTVDDLVINFMEENNIPGLSVAIVQAPYITRVVGYGFADISTKRLVASNTMFNLGEMTTAYTAVAIMQLEEDNKLKLDDPIKNYLANIPKDWANITIRELITHSSGIPSYIEAPGFDYSSEYSQEQIIKLVANKPLLFHAGEQVNKSATDFYLLGMIIEKTSGVSYEEFVTKHQFERMGLQNTCFISTLKHIKNEVNNNTHPFTHNQFKTDPIYINPTEPATGYTVQDDKLVKVKMNSQSASFANAAIISSAQDVSIWDIGLAGGILVKNPKNREFLYNSITLKNGMKIPANAGWQFPGHRGLMFITGNVPGYSTFLSRFTDPAELLCVTILANKSNIEHLEVLAHQIAGAYNSKLATPASAEWATSMQSPYSVEETIKRLSEIILSNGGKVFAHIDHSSEASKVDQELNATQVILIGNPSKGTGLMKENGSIALDLPLRAMARQDDNGEIWLSITDPYKLAKEYGIHGKDKQLKAMSDALLKAAKKAVQAY